MNTGLESLYQMAHAESLQEIYDLTYQITGNPLFITDTYLIAICVKSGTEEKGREENQLDPSTKRILDDFRAQRHRVFFYNSALICLNGADVSIEIWVEQAPKLNQLTEKWELQAGVSRRIESLDRLLDYYQQAQSALELGI